MIHPSYSELLETLNNVKQEEDPVIDSRYSLVIASAKRARQLVDGQEAYADHVSIYKPLSIAVEEIREGKIYITKEGVDDFKPIVNMDTQMTFSDADGAENEDAE